MLDPDQLKRISTAWRPAEWPEATNDYVKVGYRRPFGYHLDRIRHLGLSGELLIDAGCGSGRWSFAWASTFERVVAFDIAAQRIAAANWQKQRLDIPIVEFLTADLQKMPADDQSADVVYCNDAPFGPVPLQSALSEFFRVLKPGGVCFLGLSGLGLAFEEANGDNPRLTQRGRERIYQALSRRHLTRLSEKIKLGAARNLEAAEQLRRATTPSELLASLNCRPETISAAATIEKDLGPAFAERLLGDLAAIIAGTKADFGDLRGASVWDPDEVSVAARRAGFHRSEWAPGGWLSLQPDGSIDKVPGARRKTAPPLFEGKPRAFEMLLWKPPARRSRSAGAAKHKTSEPDRARDSFRLEVGCTTYWNAAAKDIVPPIIVSSPPEVSEFENAVITPRAIEPKLGPTKSGQQRHARGGIYDRDHKLLPSFLEREAYEAAMQKGNRLKNEPVLPECELVNAERLRGKYVYLGILRGHFGHFLLESLCRVWYIFKKDPNIKILVHSDGDPVKMPSYVHHIFQLIECPLDQIVAIKRPVVVDHLILPESEFEIRWRASSSYADTFRELYERNARLFRADATPNRVYLTRRHLNVRGDKKRSEIINNEQEVEALFEQRGFAIIAPEKRPLHEQIAIIAGAGQIAGVKGSALHMSLFCQRPKARLVQIGRKHSMNQSLINGLKGMDSHDILCQSDPSENGTVVDLDIIRAALRQM